MFYFYILKSIGYKSVFFGDAGKCPTTLVVTEN